MFLLVCLDVGQEESYREGSINLSANIKFNIKTFNNNLFKSKFAGDEHLLKPFKELEEALEILLNIERKSHNK